jgi:hypothetical protein
MTRRLAALAFALLAAVGCDSGDGGGDEGEAPAEGSCQALVDELWDNEDLAATVENYDQLGFGPDAVARGVHTQLGAPEPPPEPEISGLAYAVAYFAFCEEHGNTSAGFCDISDTLGCEG